MALYVGGTAVTGTQTLDATKLTGNLPALNGSAVTTINASSNVTVSGDTSLEGNVDLGNATSDTITLKKVSHSIPFWSNSSVILALSKPPWTPTIRGVPTAPKETGVDWIIIPKTTADTAGNPIATISGAATAAGVPNPDAPSIKHPNSHAIRITWIRRSGLILEKPLLIVITAPEYFSVLSSIMAPKIIHKIPTVIIKPWIVEAKILVKLTSQNKKAIRHVIINTIGIEYFAAKRKPTNKIPANKIGVKAKIDNISIFIFFYCDILKHLLSLYRSKY